MSLLEKSSGRRWGTHHALACCVREVFSSAVVPLPKGPGNGKVTTATVACAPGAELWAASPAVRNCFSLCSHQLSRLSLFRFLAELERTCAEVLKKAASQAKPAADAQHTSRVVRQRR